MSDRSKAIAQNIVQRVKEMENMKKTYGDWSNSHLNMSSKKGDTENGTEVIFKDIRAESFQYTNEKCVFRLKEHA